jgi:hypothetical protein
LLLEIIPEYCDPKQTNFENCFNLKAHESQVRFRILDSQLSSQYLLGITDLAIPLSQFKSLTLPIKRVIVIENKTSFYTALTLPDMSNTIVIFGSGYKIAELKQVTWFNDVELLYWGVDAQGFEIFHNSGVIFLIPTACLWMRSRLISFLNKTQELLQR